MKLGQAPRQSWCLMSKTVVCVGCSWTDQIQDNTFTYPYLIKRRHPDWTVYNLGVRGANNVFINMVLEQAIKTLSPDFVIRQVTSWNRWMWHGDDYSCQLRLLEGENGYYYSDVAAYANEVVLWTTSGLAHPFKDQFDQQELQWRNQMRSQHYDSMPLNLALELEDAALHKSRSLLADIPHLMLFWRDNSAKLPGANIWQGYPCVERDVGFEYVIDDGDHFDYEGNALLLEKIIEPCIATMK